MIIYGAIFRCCWPTLVIAASLSFRSPFFSPFDKREAADEAKRGFDVSSDHITVLEAFLGWKKSMVSGRAAEREYVIALLTTTFCVFLATLGSLLFFLDALQRGSL